MLYSQPIMITNIASTLITTVALAINLVVAKGGNLPKVIAEHKISLEKRYSVKSVNEVMKKNILLNLAYLDQTITKKSEIDWSKVTQPIHFKFTLKPNEVFAYHNDIPKEYEGKVAKTTDISFGATDGFLSDGYLYGDGVCHLASIINWVAQDAGLKADVPKDHNFAPIPEVPKEYGVSIYSDPSDKNRGINRNLYVTNDKDYEIEFHFDYQGDDLKVYVTKKA